MGTVTGLAWVRGRMENEEDVLIGASAALAVQLWARRMLRCCGSVGLQLAVRRRSELQDLHNASHPGSVVAFYGGDEFALWKNLETDLGAHDALLPPIRALNCGLEGATAGDLRRNAFQLIGRHNPSTVVLSVGSADYDAGWLSSDEDVMVGCIEDVREIINLAYNFGTRDVRLLLVPDPPGFSQGKREFMSGLTGELSKLTNTGGWYGLRLELLDIRELLGRDVDRMHDAYAGDEVRPTAYAHQLKGDVLRDLLGPDGLFPIGRPQTEVLVCDFALEASESDRLLVPSKPPHDVERVAAFGHVLHG